MSCGKLTISIITINLNDKEGLRRTIDSVIGQTYDHIEYIIIDGSSTDGSLDIIKKEEENIDYWVSEPDRGVYHAMNKGIDRATGDYLFFLNAGDYLVDDSVIDQFVSLEPLEDVIYGNIYFENNGRLKLSKYPEKITINFLYRRSLPHPATFFKSYLFQQYGKYNEKYKIISDWLFYLNLYLYTPVLFRKIDLILSVFNNEGLSGAKAGAALQKMERQDALNSIIPLLGRMLIHLAVRYSFPVSGPVKYLARLKKISRR